MTTSSHTQENTVISLPECTTKALNYICRITQSLIHLAEREAQALVQNDMTALAVLIQEKEKLAERYAHACQNFQERLTQFKSADKSLIRKMGDLQQKLHDITRDNNSFVSQIKDRSERKTQQTLLLAQEYGQRPQANFATPQNGMEPAKHIPKANQMAQRQMETA